MLGDLLCSVPALRALRRGLPDAHITLIGLPWARSFQQRFSAYLDAFLEFPGYPGLPERPLDHGAWPKFLERAHAGRFDLAIQLHGSGSFVNEFTELLRARRYAGFYEPGGYHPAPGLFLPYPVGGHEIERNLRLVRHLGIPASDTELEFPLTPDDEEDAVRACGGDLPAPYVCLHPGARFLSRQWPAERLARVADHFGSRGFQIVLTGSASEKELTRRVVRTMSCDALDLAGRTSLGGLAALLRRASLVITNDTGVSHVATAVDAPSVVVVMGSDPDRWAPLDRQRHRVVMTHVDCRPCGHYHCPIGHPCALGVEASDVIREADDLLTRISTGTNAAA